MLDAPGLIGFVTIAETGSVHSAARRLNVSQAALSRRLQRLEEALRVQLFIRSGRRLTLSESGARLLPDARAHLDGLMTVLSAIRDDAQHGRPTITIGCVPTVSHGILPDVVFEFVKRRPSARIKLLDFSAMEVPVQVSLGKADFGVGMLGMSSAGLKEQLLGEDPIVLAVHRDHPLAALHSLPWQALRGEPLIAAGVGSGVRSLLENIRNSIGVDLMWQHEVQHLKSASDWVAAGIAHAILPRLALHGNRQDTLRVVRLIDPTISRRMGILTRPNERLCSSADVLRRSVIARMTEALRLDA